jgi:hypothetical protein
MADYRPFGEPRFYGDASAHGEPTAGAGGKSSNADFTFDVASTFQELSDLLLSKHDDYGPTNISRSPGGPINGLRVRMWDKFARINNLVDSGKGPQHESLEDSFKDMANYAIIGLLVLRGKWPND